MGCLCVLTLGCGQHRRVRGACKGKRDSFHLRGGRESITFTYEYHPAATHLLQGAERAAQFRTRGGGGEYLAARALGADPRDGGRTWREAGRAGGARGGADGVRAAHSG